MEVKQHFSKIKNTIVTPCINKLTKFGKCEFSQFGKKKKQKRIVCVFNFYYHDIFISLSLAFYFDDLIFCRYINEPL
jgi:hypothetical protein